MKTSLKYLLYIAIAISVLATIWFWLQNNQSQKQWKEVVKEETEKVQLETDVYPLYRDVEWGSVEEVNDGVLKVESEPVVDTTNIAAIAMPFTEYYHDKLLAAGWEQDMMREASGPGANVSTYTKDDRFITIAFESEFKVKSDNAPSLCPCDVTLSITSGKE